MDRSMDRSMEAEGQMEKQAKKQTEKCWDVFIYGDVNIDLVIPGVTALPGPGEEAETREMETFVGGGAALFALGLGKLGVKVAFQGCVGADLYGTYILEVFRDQGLDCRFLEKRAGERTGISISFTNAQDRSFLTMRGTNEDLDISKLHRGGVKGARHFHLTGYTARQHDRYLALLQELKGEPGLTISMDLGWDPTGAWDRRIYRLFPYLDVLFMNEGEALHYSRLATAEEAARDFGDCMGAGGLAALKLGRKGSLAYRGGELVVSPGFSVEVADTTGAGDAFNAGFIYGFLQGQSPEACLRYGNGCGACTVTRLGGNSAFPNEKALKAFISK